MATKSAVQSVVRVGVGCLVTSSRYPNCVLLGQRLGSNGSGKFALPGGHLELGESWEDCAKREVYEETNLSLSQPQLVLVTNDTALGGDPTKHYITIFMTAAVVLPSNHSAANSTEDQVITAGHIKRECGEDYLLNMEPDKCAGWAWVPWRDIVQRQQQLRKEQSKESTTSSNNTTMSPQSSSQKKQDHSLTNPSSNKKKRRIAGNYDSSDENIEIINSDNNGSNHNEKNNNNNNNDDHRVMDSDVDMRGTIDLKNAVLFEPLVNFIDQVLLKQQQQHQGDNSTAKFFLDSI